MEITVPFALIDSEAERLGLEAAFRLSRDGIFTTELPIPTVFGSKWEKHFQRTQERMLNAYGDRFSELVFIANRWLVYAGANAAAVMRLHGSAAPDASETLKLLGTPSGYLEYEGMANTLSDALSAIELPSELLVETTLIEMPRREEILDAMSLYWFFQAAECKKDKPQYSLDLLFEAMDAAHCANGIYMWNEAESTYRQDNSTRKNAASELAKLRHKENYALSEAAAKYWKENIDPNLSASKAAEELLRIVPLSHKKLAEIVSLEKKKIKEE